MSAPTTTNGTATTVNQIIAGANSAAVQAVVALIIADEPWMAEPIVKDLLSDLLGWLDGYISRAEQNGATFLVIDDQVDAEEALMTQEQAAVATAEKSGIPDAIKAAILAYAAAQSALVHDDGSSPAQ